MMQLGNVFGILAIILATGCATLGKAHTTALDRGALGCDVATQLWVEAWNNTPRPLNDDQITQGEAVTRALGLMAEALDKDDVAGAAIAAVQAARHLQDFFRAGDTGNYAQLLLERGHQILTKWAGEL
jgi:hypothetical protein